MIFTLKSLILINFVKKNRLAAGPLPGITLGGEYVSAGPLRPWGLHRNENIEKIY